jgi:hypothetical protein
MSEDGTTLPATVVHAYAAAGNFTATFTVTDGEDPATFDLDVPIVAAGSTGIVFTQKQAFPSNPVSSVTDPVAGAFLGANGCVGYTANMSGQDCVFFKLDAAFVGHAFTITADAGDPDYELWPECNATPTSIDGLAMEGSTAAGPESGMIPDGAGCVVIWTKSPPDAPTHTFTVL